MLRDFTFFSLALISFIVVGVLMIAISFVPTFMIFELAVYHLSGSKVAAIAIGGIEGFIATIVFFYHYGWILRELLDFFRED